MKKDVEIHVISNTHWDREWIYNFQETRMMLVEFFDRLLDVLDHEPEYDSYLLDGQVVPVEDYLEVRPEQRDRIAKHVAAGRLFVGPWYTDPECFCVNGESLVRNLLYGHRVAQGLGGVMKVGHTPFSYGQNSQMPQIYAGFGIDTILFYHGVSHEDVANEFIFEGADGTRVLGSQMSSGARYNFYHNVYRPVVCGAGIDERIYEWSKGGLPFHLCGPQHTLEHHSLLDPPKQFDRERLKAEIEALRKAEIAVATTRYLAFMDGHDSSLPDVVTLRIIGEAQKQLGEKTIFHSNLPALMAKVKAAARNLTVLRGERRVPKPMGARVHLYSDVTSSRTRMKRVNARAEDLLQRWAEPYAAIASCLGAEYPASLLDLAWKTLLKCHAHDSIAGSGVDDIERDMHDRLRQVTNIANGLLRRSLAHVQLGIDHSDVPKDDVLLTVFNPSPFPRTEVVTATVDLPESSGYREFSLVEEGTGRKVPIQMVSRRPHHAVVNHADDATYMMNCDQTTFHFEAVDVPPLGYATYRLVRQRNAGGRILVSESTGCPTVHVKKDGTLDVSALVTLLDGEPGIIPFLDLNQFRDDGEAGHAWMHIEPAQDRIISSTNHCAVISLEEQGPLVARHRIEYRMPIPVGLEENGGDAWQRLDGAPNASRRSEQTREMVITSDVTLRKGARVVEVVTRFDNVCKNHRLRVAFPTRLWDALSLALSTPVRWNDVCHVESAFDVVQREIDHWWPSPWADAPIPPTFPMQRFVDLSAESSSLPRSRRRGSQRTMHGGLAIINDGLREYEVTAEVNHTIVLTLLRAYEVSLTTVSKRWEIHPEMTLSQCPGPHEFRYAIYPHAGTWDQAEVYREAERFTLPLEVAQTGPHSASDKKGRLPKRLGFLSVEPANLILSAVKRAEDGSGLVVRVFNPTSKALTGKLTFFKPIRSAELVSLEEKPIRKLAVHGKGLSIRVAKKKIVTLKLVLDAGKR